MLRNAYQTAPAFSGEIKEIIEYSEENNGATKEQRIGEFLFHLNKHIEELEDLYLKHSMSDPEQISDILDLIKSTEQPLSDMSLTSTRKLEGGMLFKDTETLFAAINELKDWEDRLQNQEDEISILEPKSFPGKSAGEHNLSSLKSADDTVGKTGNFQIQTGFFKTEKFALRMAVDLEANYDYPVELRSENLDGETFHRVLIGDFKSRKEAKKVFRKIKADGRKAILKEN